MCPNLLVKKEKKGMHFLRWMTNTDIQWKLSKADIVETNIFVSFRQMSPLDRLYLCNFDQQTDILGQNLFSALGGCPL